MYHFQHHNIPNHFYSHHGIYGLLGANGAGKSTLMNLITDNVRRNSGEILYNGKEIFEINLFHMTDAARINMIIFHIN